MLIKAAGGDLHIAKDNFTAIADGEALPAGTAVIVPLKRFLAERDTLLGRGTPVGVRIETNETPETLGEDVQKLALVVLHVPYFKDGRAFSWARLLRTRLHFKGEIRAAGHVLPDQLAFFARVGVDSFELKDDIPLSDIDAALHAISVVYQPSVDGRATVRELRMKREREPSKAS